MKPPRVGERDPKGRLFLGWAIVSSEEKFRELRYVPTQCDVSFGHRYHRYRVKDAQWCPRGVGGLFFEEWSEASKWLHHRDQRLVPVYRPESRVRRALRELVAEVRCDGAHLHGEEMRGSCRTCNAIENAKKALGGER